MDHDALIIHVRKLQQQVAELLAAGGTKGKTQLVGAEFSFDEATQKMLQDIGESFGKLSDGLSQLAEKVQEIEANSGLALVADNTEILGRMIANFQKFEAEKGKGDGEDARDYPRLGEDAPKDMGDSQDPAVPKGGAPAPGQTNG